MISLRSCIRPAGIVLLLFLLAGCSAGREIEAALVLGDAAGYGLYARFAPEPRRVPISFTVSGRRYGGDLYLSPAGGEAGLLLLPGAAEEGKDDPRLVAFARTLARARFSVFIPDLASFRTLKVHGENVREVADCFLWLSRRPDLSPGGRAGLAAFSYAAGPAILAALEPDVAPRARFIMAIGAYYDLPAVLTFFTTGWFRHDGRWRYLEPNDYGKWVFVLSNLERLPAEDREVTGLMARRKMEDLKADISDLALRLTPAGRDLYDFVINTDRRKAPGLMAKLPLSIRKDIESLDLANKDLSSLHPRLILFHGDDDAIIPFTQSVELKHAAPPGRAKLHLVHGLQHVDLKPGVRDVWRLWRGISSLLEERNADH